MSSQDSGLCLVVWETSSYPDIALSIDAVSSLAFKGFFMSMRAKFTAPGTSIHYYVVEWDNNNQSWADFRGKVLGPTDPAEAPADSMRGLVLGGWESLGAS